MTIVLLILRIIGIVLLVIFGLIVFFALLLLFVPVRYHAKGEYHKDAPWLVKIDVNWLLHMVSLTAELREDDNDIGLRIFGFKKNLKKAESPSDDGGILEPEVSGGSGSVAEEPEVSGGPRSVAEKPDAEDGKKEESRTEDAKEQAEESPDSRKQFMEKAKAFFRFLPDRLRALKRKLVTTWRRVRAAVKNFAETVRKIKELFGDARNYSALHFLGGKVFYLLKKLLPRKLSLNLQYSTGAPDTTGELLGVMAMFPVGYQNSWNIIPDFTAEEAYAETDFEVGGRVFLFRFLGVGISILSNRDCRYLYKKLKTIF